MTRDKLTAKEKVTRSHISIMRSEMFCMFAGVLSIGELKITDAIPTAATNGKDVMYNPSFVDSLTEKELNFLVLHETMHKVMQHLTLWAKLWEQDPMLANMAADYIVNSTIKNADPSGLVAHMPDGGLYDKKYEGMTTRQVFDLLKQDKENGEGMFKESDGGQSLDKHDYENAKKLTTEEKEELAKEIEQALRQGELIRGKMKGEGSRVVQELLAPKVDWREQLRDFISSVCAGKDISSWKRPSKRFIGQDIYMPSMQGQSVGKLVLGIDTSGSIGQAELNVFLSEVVGLCKEMMPESIELIYWGCSVVGHETYNKHDYDGLITTTKPMDGGGTTVGCLNQYIKDKQLEHEAVIVLTDGYVESDWGGVWDKPTLWAITTKNMTAPHGKSIYLPQGE